jgi:hypothetical protein
MLNPLGIQGDGIMNVQGNVDDSHDMVWYSKGLVDDGGWTVEARVPLRSLRFPSGKTLTVRCVLFRFHTRTIVDPVFGFRLTGKLGPRDTVAASSRPSAASS